MWHLCLSEITMKITPLLNLTTLNYQTKNKIKDNKSTIFLGQIDKDVFIPSKPKSKSLYDYFKNNNLVVRQVSDNIYAGETLATKPESVFEELSYSGIETIIDLRSLEEDTFEYKEKCAANGIEYVSVPLTKVLDDRKDGIFDYQKGTVRDDFVNDLATLLKYTRKGNLYLGCQYGVDRTNFALCCDYIFNYDLEHTPPVIYPTNYAKRNTIKNKNLDLIRKIIKKLTPEQREKLHLPDNFEETILKKRIKDIIDINRQSFPMDIFKLIRKNTGHSIMK